MKMSFRCFFGEPGEKNYTNHYQDVDFENIQKWIECYRFTHPNVKAISVMIAFSGSEKVMESESPGE